MVIEQGYNLYAKYIDKVKGYGVFTNNFISIGSIIETCYCLKVSGFEWDDYSFGDPKVLPLGFGAIYNHSDNANAIWRLINEDVIAFEASRDINPGEEICHNYGPSYWKDRQDKKLI